MSSSKKQSSRNGINPRLIRGIIAVIAAILLWFYINGSSIDLVEKDILDIPVTIEGMETINEKGLFVSDDTSQYYINLRLRGSEKNLKNLTASSFTATADLSDIASTGSYSVDIVIQGLPNSVILEEMKPSSITFNIEEYTEKKEEVKFIVNGQPAEGYEVQSITTEQKVTVEGLSSDLGKISQVAATISVIGLNANTIQTIQPIAYDINGNVIDSVEISPKQINVTIAIKAKGQ